MESISSPVTCGRLQPRFDAFAAVRADGYILLASLLLDAPARMIIDILQNLQWSDALPEKLEQAFGVLRQACRNCRLADVQNEYNRLFVGLGCGEIVPYESWYRDKRIQSAPLAVLRADLMKLGIVRQTDCHDSEDHAGALCEIMAIVANKQSGIGYDEQSAFFNRHVAPWMMDCFKDIEKARNADFYRSVGLFGRLFLETDGEFLRDAANG